MNIIFQKKMQYKDSIRDRVIIITLAISLLFITILSAVYLGVVRFEIIHSASAELSQANNSIRNIVYESARSSIKNRLRGHLARNMLLLREKYPPETTPPNLRKEAADFLVSQKIGKNGYYYILNSRGIVLYHPKEALVGQDVTGFAFIHEQIRQKNGYLEYEWKNPGETTERDKVLYMDYIPEWDWIVSASAYKSDFPDLVVYQDFEDAVRSYTFGESGYSFVMDDDGKFLIHPFYQGMYSHAVDVINGSTLYDRMVAQKKGQLEYDWLTKRDGSPRKKIIVFDYIDEFGWYVGSTAYIDEYNRERVLLRNLTLFILLVFVLLATVIILFMDKLVAKPLAALVRRMDKAGATSDLSVLRRWPHEIRRLYEGFARYSQTIRSKTQELEKANRQMQILVHFADDNPNPVFRLTKDFIPVYANARGEVLMSRLGLSLGEKLPDNYHRLVASIARSGIARDFTYDQYTYLLTISWIEDIEEYYLFALDVTDLRKFASQAILSESIFENSVEGICITNKDGAIERVNHAFERITGYTEEEVKGENPRILRSDYHDAAFYEKMWKSLIETGSWAGEIWNRRKNGESYPEYLIIQAIMNSSGEIENYLSIFHDTSEIKSKEEKIKLYQYYDILTSLPNKSLFFDRLSFSVANSRRSGKHIALMLLDIDNYKRINDTFGYATGDEMIQAISVYFQSIIDDDMLLARIEGNKFAILISSHDAEHRAAELTSRIYSKDNYEVHLHGTSIYLTFSIGISVFPFDDTEPAALFRCAELALYDVKDSGKNSYKMYNTQMQQRAAHRIHIESQLKGAMENGEMFLMFQPQVDMKGRIFGFEALIRWNHNGTIIPPDEFISVAEETGLVKEIGTFALDKCAALIRKIEDTYGLAIKGAVNISGTHFSDETLAHTISESVQKYDISPDLMDIEITEHTSVQDIELTMQRMRQIVEAGCSISIDDFGTGYSSLNYLSLFPVTFLKIDRAFIQKIGESEQSDNLVTSIISLAHSLKLKVISEGVETNEQWDFLARHSCDFIQGYYVSRPVLEEEFLTFVESNMHAKHKG